MRGRAWIAAVSMVVVGLAFPTSSAVAADGGTPRIMVVGDSISQGSAGDFTWRYRLYTHLKASGVTPDMVGVRRHLFDNVADSQTGPDRMAYVHPFDQDHAAWWGQRAADKVSQIQAEVQATQPHYLLLLMGINDVAADQDPTAALKQVIRNARAAKPDVRIVLGTLVPTEIELQADRTDFRDLARAANFGIVDIRDTMSTTRSPIRLAFTRTDFDPALHTYDGVHPNSRGEVRIAAAFADALAGFGVGTSYPRPLANPPLGPRTPPTLTSIPDGFNVDLSWSKVPGAMQYQVYRRLVTTDPDAPWFPVTALRHWNERSVSLPLHPGERSEYAVRPVKSFFGRDPGAWSNTRLHTTPAPTVSATGGANQLWLSWSSINHVQGYEIRKRVGQGEWELLWPTTSTSFHDFMLPGGRRYDYQVRGYTQYGKGTWSSTASVWIP
ncbi:GDSL-type esterase/lipase family protein [Nocardioides daphniae]|uniref:Fibronectin type-III domain-containing protein n=1 Tax=Nocardioides daphniae TaxID=402297 RepID=A0ABQ1Q515_9ACTN|nr:GDSL-type esterase/lipase family protein [Nocardioides daphniae]GGD12262.1 hypothetical protein GCM10007231_09030 [Nocardioides daphniae]